MPQSQPPYESYGVLVRENLIKLQKETNQGVV